MVISNMSVLLILIVVSLKLGLGDVVTYDVECGDSCKKKCEDKGFKFEKCAKAAKYSSDKNDAKNQGRVPNYCSCTTPPCTSGKERCANPKNFPCKDWKGSIYCNPKRNQCECTCDPVKCEQYCKGQGLTVVKRCEDDVTYGLLCMCSEPPRTACSPQKTAFNTLAACRKKDEFKDCDSYGKLICSPPKEGTTNRFANCKCNCDAGRCTEYCKKQNKKGECKPLDTMRAINQKWQGEYCKCT